MKTEKEICKDRIVELLSKKWVYMNDHDYYLSCSDWNTPCIDCCLIEYCSASNDNISIFIKTLIDELKEEKPEEFL